MSLILLFGMLFAQISDSTEKGKPVSEHTLGEELITGEAELKASDQKYFSPLPFDPWSPVNDLLVSDSYILDNALIKSIDSMTVPQRLIRSSFLRIPVERSFIYGDVLVFLPKFEKRVATWELLIANSLGETVRRIRESGHPPAAITWDGRDDKGEPVMTGEIYSFTFYAYDAQGNQTRISCEPQQINAIVWQEKNGWLASIAADVIFQAGEVRLQADANIRLDEIANLIKERFKKEVVIYVYTEIERLSSERSRVIEVEIKKRVVLPKDALKVAPRFIPGLQPKNSRIEVHIL